MRCWNIGVGGGGLGGEVAAVWGTGYLYNRGGGPGTQGEYPPYLEIRLKYNFVYAQKFYFVYVEFSNCLYPLVSLHYRAWSPCCFIAMSTYDMNKW